MRPATLRHVHSVLTVLWLVMVPVALSTGWLGSVAFVSACSIYANAVGHASAWQAAKAQQAAET